MKKVKLSDRHVNILSYVHNFNTAMFSKWLCMKHEDAWTLEKFYTLVTMYGMKKM
jgi:hypothetical protein